LLIKTAYNKIIWINIIILIPLVSHHYIIKEMADCINIYWSRTISAIIYTKLENRIKIMPSTSSSQAAPLNCKMIWILLRIDRITLSNLAMPAFLRRYLIWLEKQTFKIIKIITVIKVSSPPHHSFQIIQLLRWKMSLVLHWTYIVWAIILLIKMRVWLLITWQQN